MGPGGGFWGGRGMRQLSRACRAQRCMYLYSSVAAPTAGFKPATACFTHPPVGRVVAEKSRSCPPRSRTHGPGRESGSGVPCAS
eukprot:scaffold15240_cov128-Isochrysis_galbana.AAC.4